MTLAELREEVEKLDTNGDFTVYPMENIENEEFADYDLVSYRGACFNQYDEYFYIWEGYLVSISSLGLHEYYEAALDELTEGKEVK